jgi:hypothetical protein
MPSHSCIDAEAQRQRWTLFPGVLNGNIRGHHTNSSPCSSLDFKHEEFACFHEKSTSLLPPRETRERARLPLSLFTILRHPIDRIGAQAFYGNTVGPALITQNIIQHCLPNISQSSFNLNGEFRRCRVLTRQDMDCPCLYRTLHDSFHTLQTNESLWFEWFASPAFGDAYMSNYYIKRLVGGIRSTSQQDETTAADAAPARDCLLNISKDCTGHDLLQELLPSVKCSSQPLENMTLARIQAEDLLRTQYDFSILEHLSDPSAPFFFQSLLRERDIDRIRSSLNRSRTANPGFIDLLLPGYAPPHSPASSLKYAAFFPKAVLSFLFADNAEDIALYHSALKMYRHRIQRLMSEQQTDQRGR